MSDISDTETSTEEAREVIEELARRKGSFTDVFRREAEEEAKNWPQGDATSD
jgi:hypothetical protein